MINSIQLLIKLKKEKIKTLISKLKNKIYVKGKKPFDDSIVITIGKKRYND